MDKITRHQDERNDGRLGLPEWIVLRGDEAKVRAGGEPDLPGGFTLLGTMPEIPYAHDSRSC